MMTIDNKNSSIQQADSCVVVVQTFFKIPMPTLQALIPVVQSIDPSLITAQMKLLGSQDPDNIAKMVYFLNNVSAC